jgi:hypothetical protein
MQDAARTLCNEAQLVNLVRFHDTNLHEVELEAEDGHPLASPQPARRRGRQAHVLGHDGHLAT